ncbi:MAG TPA: hypothetical protein VHD81_06810 [Mycobacteriales bacterium]|nr:hypothetical protein [Mycobacteriales bacterium]
MYGDDGHGAPRGRLNRQELLAMFERLRVAQAEAAAASCAATAAESGRANALRGQRQSGPATPTHVPA